MALDHYVSQVHLKNFTSASRGGRQLLCIRKSDLKKFPCNPKDVCRIEDGSTNAYLLHDRAIEDFLRVIEPQYNTALLNIRSGTIDGNSVDVIAGFIAYVKTCSPTAMRLLSAPLERILEATAAMAELQGAFPTAPEELGGKTLVELLSEGVVKFDVDQKYPQAIGISNILDVTNSIGNGDWDIIRNPHPDLPFFTSDYPVGVSYTRDNRIADHLVPLAPDLAVCIHPEIDPSPGDQLGQKTGFRYRYLNASRTDVRRINQIMVRCAEDLIFYTEENKWIDRFVAKNAMYKVEMRVDQIPMGGGYGVISRLGIVDTRKSP